MDKAGAQAAVIIFYRRQNERSFERQPQNFWLSFMSAAEIISEEFCRAFTFLLTKAAGSRYTIKVCREVSITELSVEVE